MNEKIENNIKKFQENLLCIRKLFGLPTTEAAAKLLGTSRQTVANLEQGSTEMSFFQYVAIKSIYHISADKSLMNIKRYATRISKDMSRKDFAEIMFNISLYIRTPFFRKDVKRLGYKVDKFLEDYHTDEYKEEESRLAILYLTGVNTIQKRHGARTLKESQEEIEKRLSFLWALENALSLDDINDHVIDYINDLSYDAMLSIDFDELMKSMDKLIFK